MSDGAAFSTLLSSPNGASGTTTIQGDAGVDHDLVTFRPSGSTSLNPRGSGSGSDRWFLKLASKHDFASGSAGGRPVENFVTVQIDRVTGRTRIHQL